MDPARITFDPGAARAAPPTERHESLDHVERMECIERVERILRVERRAGGRTRSVPVNEVVDVIDMPSPATQDPAPRRGLVLNGVWVPLAR